MHQLFGIAEEKFTDQGIAFSLIQHPRVSVSTCVVEKGVIEVTFDEIEADGFGEMF